LGEFPHSWGFLVAWETPCLSVSGLLPSNPASRRVAGVQTEPQRIEGEAVAPARVLSIRRSGARRGQSPKDFSPRLRRCEPSALEPSYPRSRGKTYRRGYISNIDTGGEFGVHRLFTGRQLGKPALAGAFGLADESRGGHGGRAAEFATSVTVGTGPCSKKSSH